MSQSRHVWLVGCAVGGLLTFAVLSFRLATSEYRLRVSVTNNLGPLAGVWVALGESDVRTTDAQGDVVFKGTRFGLDDTLLTVSDPSMNLLHLSESRRTRVSWLPWERESELKVNLSMLGESSSSVAGTSEDTERLGIDLPPLGGDEPAQTGKSADGVPTIPLLPLQEEILSGADEVAAAAESVVPESRQSVYDSSSLGLKMCMASGLSDVLCESVLAPVVPPLRDSKNSEQRLVQKSTDEKTRVPAQIQQTNLADKTTEVSSEKSVTQRFGVRLEVTEDGRPLEGARIFMSRMRDKRVREIGSTSSDGKLDSRIPREFFGETVTIFHSCCAPKSFAAKFSGQAEPQILKVQLNSGKGFGVSVFQQAYGLLRKVEQTEVFSESAKIAVSGNEGFALYDASKTPGIFPSRVLVRNARPAEFRIPANSSTAAPLNFIVTSEETFLPSLAVVERSGGKSFQGVLKSSDVRRWRREFMTRLMRLTSVRTVVSVEAEARVADAGESLPDVMSRGWSETHLAGEWDFLLSIHYDEETGKVNLSAINARGEEFFGGRILLAGGEESPAAESMARRNFDAFLKAFPFEGAVLQQRGSELALSFENSEKYGLSSGSHLALFQETPEGSGDRRIEDLAALAVVNDKSKGKLVDAQITHWNQANRKTEVLPDLVRVVKISREEYLRASKRKGMKSLQTSALNTQRSQAL